MKEIIKLKPGEAALLFKPEGISMILNNEGIDPDIPPTSHVSNAACIAYALQHPLFLQMTVKFIADVEQLKNQVQSGMIH